MREITIPIRNMIPIESQRFFDREKIPDVIDMLTLQGPLPKIFAVPYQKKVILPDGHTRTIVNAIRGLETQRIALLETEEDRIQYGRGALLASMTLADFIDEYRKNIREDMLQEGINSVYDYPIMRYRAEILKMTGIKQ